MVAPTRAVEAIYGVRMDTRADRKFSLVAAVFALVALLAAGVVGISASRGDQVTMFGLFMVSGYWQAPVIAVLLAVVAAAIAVRRARWAWATVTIGMLAAIACFGVGAAIESEAREVNEWIAVEGTASIDSPFTRWIGSEIGEMTVVDVGEASLLLMAAGILQLLCVALAGWSLWARRRAVERSANDAPAPATV